jgi:hypothetical protein
MDSFLEKLNQFLGKATLSTYASGGKEADPEKPGFSSRFPGFKEFEYGEGDFYYRDSYSGFFVSSGQEAVWYKGIPVWVQSYGGGMEPKFRKDEEFAHQTFSFLKRALSSGEKVKSFQPRGKSGFKEGDWEYNCEWSGDITSFKGYEKITHKKEVVFTHHFFGFVILYKNENKN